ncbi:hypothetical protein HMPREF9946_01254, partial [Acetobacteraceae bacterium AT-5844]
MPRPFSRVWWYRWLVPFLAVLGRKTRRTWAPLYLRGLLGLVSARACSRR